MMDLIDTEADPTPATRRGASAMVERFYALKRTEGVGGVGGVSPVTTSPTPLPSPHSKSDIFVSVVNDPFQFGVILPTKKAKRV